ncbi:MAG: DUF2953 domain-containing protein [Eubacteriales bacterium]|nr:DUF2953 domain-containing protein [Eubacteriales bacterium]
MLHILLLILKIIGFILAVILGVLVLLICVALFLPVKYHAEGDCNGIREINGLIKVRWLFGLIRVHLIYKDHKAEYMLHIAWKKISNQDSGKEKDKDEEQSEKDDSKGKDEKVDPQETCYQEDHENDENPDKEIQDIQGKYQEESCLQQICEKDVETVSQPDEEKRNVFDKEHVQADRENNKTDDPGFERLRESIEKIKCKIKSVFDNIKCTWNRLYDKIKELSDKKDIVSEFISSEIHQSALRKMKKEGIHLIKRLKPKKIELDLEYGFDDPSLTGRLLALLSMIYPFFEGNIHVLPDFQNKKMIGKCLVKGRILIWDFVYIAIKLILSKCVRQSYKDIRHLQLG